MPLRPPSGGGRGGGGGGGGGEGGGGGGGVADVLSSLFRQLNFNPTPIKHAILETLVFQESQIPITIDTNGAIFATQSAQIVAANSGTTDNLDTITWFDGTPLFLMLTADTGDTITIRHDIDNIVCWGGSDITLTDEGIALLRYLQGPQKWVAMGDSFSSSSHAQSHALLDGGTNHNDTATDAVSRGSLIIGNSTPAWDELVIGANGTILVSNGTDPSWSTTVPDHANQHGNGGSDSMEATNLTITGNWDVSGTTGRIKIQTGAGVPSHTEAEGTLYWDTTNNVLYCNNDGSTAWTEIGSGSVDVSPLFQDEQASADADVAGDGQWWTKSNTPNQPMFTSDDGHDYALGNQWFSIPLIDTVVHASDIKGASSYKGGPANQTTANWVAQAWCITAIPGGGTTCSIEVHRIRSGTDTTVATVTITASNTRGSASSAFTNQNDDIFYLLHTGGTSGDGDLIGVDIYRQ